MSRDFLLKSLARTAKNLPQVLEGWPSFDTELQDHYAAALNEILIDAVEFKAEAWPSLRIIWDLRGQIDSVMRADLEGLFLEIGFDFSNE